MYVIEKYDNNGHKCISIKGGKDEDQAGEAGGEEKKNNTIRKIINEIQLFVCFVNEIANGTIAKRRRGKVGKGQRVR